MCIRDSFICGGAFEGIERKIAKRKNTRVVGYANKLSHRHLDSEDESLLKYVEPADLRAFGLIPELIGRVPVLTYLTQLSREALKLSLIHILIPAHQYIVWLLILHHLYHLL